MKLTPINLTGERPRLSAAWIEAGKKSRAMARPSNVAENELILYGEIGYDWWTGEGLTAGTVQEFLKNLPNGTEEISVRINSPGGDVFEGVAMYNLLINSGLKVNVKIDALAASIATIIAMAGNHISMAGNGQFMIHKAWTVAAGNADDMRSTAALLDSIDKGSIISTYAARTKISDSELEAMMTGETWLDAKAALDKGFINEIAELRRPSSADTAAADKAAADLKAQNSQLENSRLRNKHNKMRARLVA